MNYQMQVVIGGSVLTLLATPEELLAKNSGGVALRPNILFIVSEDNGPQLGCYGAPIKTPNLDQLASHGVRFDNAYVPQAGSSPSRASFLTGLYPHQNGQVGLATWRYSMYNPTTPNMVNDLKKSGYRTGIVGKLHINPATAFDFDMHKIKESNFKRANLKSYERASMEFVNADDEPFYLQVNYPDAHEPFMAQVEGLPKDPLTANDVESMPLFGVTSQELRELTANYYNSIRRLDALVGDLITGLKSSGKYENTLIIYIGDHGVDLLRGKRTVYEGGTKIPMIISWPSARARGLVYRPMVSTIDIYPTVMEVTGNNIPKHLPGASLMPAINGSKEPVREYLFTEYNVHSNHNPYPQRAVCDGRFKLIYNPIAGVTNPGVRYTLGKLTEPFNITLKSATVSVAAAYRLMENPPEYELYDLNSDPHEWTNLSDRREHRQVLNRLKRAMTKWQKQTQDPFIDKTIARRFFDDIMATKQSKVEIPYHHYMNPNLTF